MNTALISCEAYIIPGTIEMITSTGWSSKPKSHTPCFNIKSSWAICLHWNGRLSLTFHAMCTVHPIKWVHSFVMVSFLWLYYQLLIIYLIILFKVIALALGQYDRPSDSEVTLKNTSYCQMFFFQNWEPPDKSKPILCGFQIWWYNFFITWWIQPWLTVKPIEFWEQ